MKNIDKAACGETQAICWWSLCLVSLRWHPLKLCSHLSLFLLFSKSSPNSLMDLLNSFFTKSPKPIFEASYLTEVSRRSLISNVITCKCLWGNILFQVECLSTILAEGSHLHYVKSNYLITCDQTESSTFVNIDLEVIVKHNRCASKLTLLTTRSPAHGSTHC